MVGEWKAGGFAITEMLDMLEAFGFKLIQTVPTDKQVEYIMHKSPGVFESLH